MYWSRILIIAAVALQQVLCADPEQTASLQHYDGSTAKVTYRSPNPPVVIDSSGRIHRLQLGRGQYFVYPPDGPGYFMLTKDPESARERLDELSVVLHKVRQKRVRQRAGNEDTESWGNRLRAYYHYVWAVRGNEVHNNIIYKRIGELGKSLRDLQQGERLQVSKDEVNIIIEYLRRAFPAEMPTSHVWIPAGTNHIL